MKTLVDDVMEKMPEQFNMLEIMAKVEERTPYVIVCFQVSCLPPELCRVHSPLSRSVRG